MSAVASVPAVNGSHDSSKDSNPEHSPSRFTAVNGRDQGSLPSHNNNNNNSSNSNSNSNNTNNSNPSYTGPTENNSTAAHNEEPSVNAPTERDRASRNSVTPSHQPEQPGESANPSTQDPEPTYVASDGLSSPKTNRNKRKRSESGQTSPSSYQENHSVSPSPVPQPNPQIQGAGPNGASHMQSTSEADAAARKARQAYSAVPERSVSVQSTGNTSPWDNYDTQLANHAQLGHQPIDSSDAQLAEALQRDVQGPEHAAKIWSIVPEGESANESRKFTLSDTPPQERPIGPVQVGPKRKRVFSNRTKTGCMTCRRRKKKCDEQHPACNNCLRGGFLCEGYSSRSTWQKPSTSKAPVPLQAKDGYSEVPHFIPDMSPQRHDRAPAAIPTNNGKSRPIPVDEIEHVHVPSQHITSVAGVGSRGSWSNVTWPSGPSSFTPEHPAQRQSRDGPGINKISRAEQPKSDYHSALREMSHGAPHQKRGMPVFQGNIDQRPKHQQQQQPHVDATNYPAQARLALNMESHVAFEATKTEKEKMLAGEPYQNYFDPQLNRERERCKAALWRYNNASNPNLGISPDERRRLLQQVLMPPLDPQAEPSPNTPVGSLGPCAIVETPFNCHFGYNINIGEDVLISENCLLADDCPINIGAHTWIGPNVTILGSMAMGSMLDRKGSRSKYQGRPVVIAEDCWIGAGATILPGVSLGRGAYIAPGEVVKQQILPYGFQGLKPNFP
ncbi:C6 zinc finger domain-containing protein [Histoplasma capsulatum var. duboisii H88]|uniref:C6 zinc finger domain-containing protein n=1 Tax=Ajellomyces capsulatus (strain H88) TaxID=544711 RepID=F0US69_AJEC8|nr:C6 zinc finger domain-containing protein [Histoplasma capsulatum var. duboisii H88]